MRPDGPPGRYPHLVWVAGSDPATSWPRTRRATGCATPRKLVGEGGLDSPAPRSQAECSASELHPEVLETPAGFQPASAALQAAASALGHEVMAAALRLERRPLRFKGACATGCATPLLAESAGIEPAPVLPGLRFSKPAPYRSVNPPMERPAGFEPAPPTWQAGMPPTTPWPHGGDRGDSNS